MPCTVDTVAPLHCPVLAPHSWEVVAGTRILVHDGYVERLSTRVYLLLFALYAAAASIADIAFCCAAVGAAPPPPPPKRHPASS